MPENRELSEIFANQAIHDRKSKYVIQQGLDAFLLEHQNAEMLDRIFVVEYLLGVKCVSAKQ